MRPRIAEINVLSGRARKLENLGEINVGDGRIDGYPRGMQALGASVRRTKRQARDERCQLVLWKPRGGKRRGAGRPPKGARAGSAHKTRPALAARHPVHVVLRVVSAIGSLRRRSAYRAVREATLVAARREDFRIVHLSLQRTHIHMLVEADDKRALAVGMQSFQVSAAKQLNTEIGRARKGVRRTGTVFPDRYYAEVITSPTQARRALAYVLANWRHHGEDRAAYARGWKVDPYSSALLFPDWIERAEQPFLWRFPEGYDPLIVHRPRTWLLRVGWQRAGMPISYREVPAAARVRR